MNSVNQGPFNSYVDQAFRNNADRDYIAARILYRHSLDSQFFWASLQALEKYLKAILLYNGQSTKKLSHNLVKAYAQLHNISDICFDFPSDVEKFIQYINKEGLDFGQILPP